jgi:hypothetical protein
VDHDPWRRDLRVAIAGGDAAAIVAVLHGSLPDDGRRSPAMRCWWRFEGSRREANELAVACVSELRSRGLEGDEELAAALSDPSGSACS